MDFLQTLLENTQIPLFSAFLLGLMMAISPCPLAMNITAIGFIGKDLENRRRVFYNGLVYTLGHAIEVIQPSDFYSTSSTVSSSFRDFFQEWGREIEEWGLYWLL